MSDKQSGQKSSLTKKKTMTKKKVSRNGTPGSVRKGRAQSQKTSAKKVSANRTDQLYQGYDLDRKAAKNLERNKPWFWKVLLISLLLTFIAVGVACASLFHRDQMNTEAIQAVNAANTIDDMLLNHRVMTIVENYSHLVDGTDYKTTRQIRPENGDIFAYYKVEGTMEDYKEVVAGKALYRYDEKAVKYYALIGDDYFNLLAKLRQQIYQCELKDTVDTTKDRGDVTTMRLLYNVKEGDEYSKRYGFPAGSQIIKNITMESKTKYITSVEEKCGDEVFYSYTVEFDGKKITPKFYSTVKKTEDTRTCTVYSWVDDDDGKSYKYRVPYEVYFTVEDRPGYKVCLDEEGEDEFTELSLATQNVEAPISLYILPDDQK